MHFTSHNSYGEMCVCKQTFRLTAMLQRVIHLNTSSLNLPTQIMEGKRNISPIDVI